MMDEFFSKCLNLNQLREHDLCVCGTSLTACALIKYLQKNGCRIRWWVGKAFEGIQSQRLQLYGVRICAASQVAEITSEVSYCLIACEHTREAKHYIEKLSSLLPLLEIQNKQEAHVDISGRCQLRCPSCQVANHAPGSLQYGTRGMMEPELFRDIIGKLKADYPNLLSVCLFNYGEPLLSPYLAEYIRYVHDMGLLCVVSSNLSVKCDLFPILDAGPDVLKISVSGYRQEIYETTHVGGDIELVLYQMQRVREILDELSKKNDILTMVGYHLYNNNDQDDFLSMQSLCEALGFLFQPIDALFCNIPKLIGYDQMGDKDVAFIRKYYREPDRILKSKNSGNSGMRCSNEVNRVYIDYDGRVMLCCLVLHKDGLFRNYLDVTAAEINAWKRSNPICLCCKQAGMAVKD